MQYNKNPISLREGHALIYGVEVMDGVKMTINFTPETWTGRQLNETTPSTRWVGATITGADVVTCGGCGLTGDLPLTALDAESGSVVDDVINFNIKNII